MFKTIAAAALGLLLAAPAAATHFRYGHFSWDRTSRLLVDAELPDTPSEVSLLGPRFYGLPGTINGAPKSFKLTLLRDGGLLLTDDATGNSQSFTGERLYTGTDSAPEFVARRVTLDNSLPGGPKASIFMVAVPEPGSWAMLIVGFGLTGAVARRRRPAAA